MYSTVKLGNGNTGSNQKIMYKSRSSSRSIIGQTSKATRSQTPVISPSIPLLTPYPVYHPHFYTAKSTKKLRNDLLSGFVIHITHKRNLKPSTPSTLHSCTTSINRTLLITITPARQGGRHVADQPTLRLVRPQQMDDYAIELNSRLSHTLVIPASTFLSWWG